ncbi:PASTA domain-containing protein [Protofrankia symbiont of Coriaria myrtifolia]|nr:PASTA domain-containing protein [Protofrankia symbiont of Coriaria myrtifolia]
MATPSSRPSSSSRIRTSPAGRTQAAARPTGSSRVIGPVPLPIHTRAEYNTAPNVIGMTLDNAVYTFRSRDFLDISYTGVCAGSPNVRHVLGQRPEAGAYVSTRTSVTLLIQAEWCTSTPSPTVSPTPSPAG